MKLRGDLLKWLNIQKNNDGQFEFRKQFEIIENENDIIKCTTEEKALDSFSTFLLQFKKPLLLQHKSQYYTLKASCYQHWIVDLRGNILSRKLSGRGRGGG